MYNMKAFVNSLNSASQSIAIYVNCTLILMCHIISFVLLHVLFIVTDLLLRRLTRLSSSSLFLRLMLFSAVSWSLVVGPNVSLSHLAVI